MPFLAIDIGNTRLKWALYERAAMGQPALAHGAEFLENIDKLADGPWAGLATPDRMRGRVAAVENVFIGASNELGAFESGAAAALVGAVPAVVVGGTLTVVAALVWPRLYPAMARIDRLESLRPAPET